LNAAVDLVTLVKAKAKTLNFSLIGICRAEYSPECHDHLLRWLENGYHGRLAYMARNPRLRSDPRLLMAGAKSAIVVGLNYYREPEYNPQNPYLSIYGRSHPYQEIIRAKLHELLEYIKTLMPDVRGKIAVDTSPTFDRMWAQKAGLGWLGKNTLLINKNLGSFVFLGELFLDIELTPDQPSANHCAGCSRCLDACPTKALVAPFILDATKCISYLTIVSDSPIDNLSLIGNNVLGCDLCQLVCPYNKTAVKADDFISPNNMPGNLPGKEEMINYSEFEFNNRFAGTIIADYGFKRFAENARAVHHNLHRASGAE
jgi:epoxyqueuosine reductase